MAKVRALREATQLPRTVRGHVTGRFLGWSPGGEALIDHPDNPHGPIAARVLDAARGALRSDAGGRDVLLVFDGERSDHPIIVGTIHADARDPKLEAARHDVVVDGRRVEINGAEEIVLRCGEAYICLRANGRVVLHGTHIESDSDGINRIKGGIVKVN